MDTEKKSSKFKRSNALLRDVLASIDLELDRIPERLIIRAYNSNQYGFKHDDHKGEDDSQTFGEAYKRLITDRIKCIEEKKINQYIAYAPKRKARYKAKVIEDIAIRRLYDDYARASIAEGDHVQVNGLKYEVIGHKEVPYYFDGSCAVVLKVTGVRYNWEYKTRILTRGITHHRAKGKKGWKRVNLK